MSPVLDTTTVVVAVSAGAAVGLARGPRPARRLEPRLEHRAPAWAGRRLFARPRRAPSVRPFVEAWAAQLRAGSPVDAALRDALADTPSVAPALARTAAAVSIAGDVGAALRTDAEQVGDAVARSGLRAAAACWSVAQSNGGRLADALDRVADGMRADETHRAHVRAQLAGPRATARLLAGLPLFAALMSSGLGLSPLHVLLSDGVGRCALAAGVLLDTIGLVWTARLAASAERDA